MIPVFKISYPFLNVVDMVIKTITINHFLFLIVVLKLFSNGALGYNLSVFCSNYIA